MPIITWSDWINYLKITKKTLTFRLKTFLLQFLCTSEVFNLITQNYWINFEVTTSTVRYTIVKYMRFESKSNYIGLINLKQLLY